MNSFDPSRFAIPIEEISRPKKTTQKRFKKGVRFLKGPIPWLWLSKAANLPGKSLHVALALWHLSGLRKSVTITLSNTVPEELGVDRHAKNRALNWLQKEGLISFEKSDNQNPRVTILDTPDDETSIIEE